MRITKFSLSGISLVFFLIVCLTSCKSQSSKLGDKLSDSEIEQLVKELNEKCPINYEIGKATSYSIEGKSIVINYSNDEDVLLLEKMDKNVVYDVWRLMYLDNCSKEDKNLVKSIVLSGYGIKCVFTGSNSNKKVVIDITNEQLKNNKPLTIEENITTNIEIAKVLLPQQLDKFTKMVEIDLDKEKLTYIYEINEDMIEMSTIENDSSIKNSLDYNISQQFINNSSTGDLFKKLCLSGRGVSYRYIGSKTGKIVELNYSSQELKQMANSK